MAHRVAHGGHDVPEDKIRGRYERLWSLVREAIHIVDEARVYDSSRAAGYRRVANFAGGRAVGTPQWPSWAPDELRRAAT